MDEIISPAVNLGPEYALFKTAVNDTARTSQPSLVLDLFLQGKLVHFAAGQEWQERSNDKFLRDFEVRKF
jgi:hypothetical protein